MDSGLDWSGSWPRLVPAHFGRWLLRGLAIYAAVALAIAVASLLAAARLRGYTFPLWVLGAACVAVVASRDLGLVSRHR